MEGSSHSYHLALHCLGVLRTRRDEIRAHCCQYELQALFRALATYVLAIFRDGCFQDLILRVTPHTALDDDADLSEVSLSEDGEGLND